MIRAHDVQTVRDAEAKAMASLADDELMGRASLGLAEVAAARLDERQDATVVALVGSGDNGGDALYALAQLSEAGFACAAVLVGEGGRAAAHQGALEAAGQWGVDLLVAHDDVVAAAALVAEGAVVLDGIVGIGGRPGLREPARTIVDAIADDAWVIAVDLASGLDPEGEIGADHTVWADETVTFGTVKPAHVLPAGEPATGRLTVIDIGVDFTGRAAAVERLVWDDVTRLWPVPAPSDDKYSRGVLGIVAGGESYTGAALLCVTAAAEAGVGMVRYVGTSTPTALVQAAVPEAVVGAGHVQAWVIGPGFDPDAEGEDAGAMLHTVHDVIASDLPIVVDAGALGLLDGTRTAPTLITPHAGEAATLLTRLGSAAVSRAEVASSPLRYARRLAELSGATVLLKGATTLVVGPDGSGAQHVRSQADGTPWLATAGSGDVLAGVIGALLSAGLSPIDAGSLGALVHGAAAHRVSRGGPLRALALAHGIRPTVRDLLVREQGGMEGSTR